MIENIFFLIGTIIFLILSALSSATETAITTMSPVIIHKLATAGNKKAIFLQKLHSQKEAMISVILLCNNGSNIFLSSFTTAFFVNKLGNEGLIIASFLTTIFVLIFAEVLPKTYAFANAESFSIRIAPIMRVLFHLLYPVVMFIETIVKIINKVLHLDKKSTKPISSMEELKGALDLYHKDGAIVKEDRDMIGGVINLVNLTIHKIMIHRTNVETINIDDDIENITNFILKSNYTRFPVWRDNPENIIGILHSKNFMRILRNKNITNNDVMNIISKPFFIPEFAKVKNQLSYMQKNRIHFGIVVNEHGDIQGIVTMEDILEEIVGSIEDEHDPINNQVIAQEDDHYLIETKVSILDLNRMLDWNLPDDANTLGGLLALNLKAYIPNSEFVLFNIKWKIIEVINGRVTLVSGKRI